MLLRHGLREANVAYDRLHIKTGASGKPYFADSHLYFNISHSQDWVICAISDVEIGCDIEKVQPANLQIAERFFCPEEYHHIAKQRSTLERNLLFYRYWTLKESFLKATGLGLSLPLNAFCMELGECIRVNQSVDQREYAFVEFDDISGYCCAACIARAQPEISLQVIDLHA